MNSPKSQQTAAPTDAQTAAGQIGRNEAATNETAARSLQRIDLSRATALTPEVEKLIEDIFEYHPWAPEQTAAGIEVRNALKTALGVIILKVPPSADRSTAIRKLREARMDCNSAITHNGKY